MPLINILRRLTNKVNNRGEQKAYDDIPNQLYYDDHKFSWDFSSCMHCEVYRTLNSTIYLQINEKSRLKSFRIRIFFSLIYFIFLCPHFFTSFFHSLIIFFLSSIFPLLSNLIFFLPFPYTTFLLLLFFPVLFPSFPSFLFRSLPFLSFHFPSSLLTQ